MSVSPSIAKQDDFQTVSEWKVYNLFNSVFGSSEDHWVFADVNYVDAGRKLSGQVDFIYLDSRIILFFEVKGGTLSYDKATGRLSKSYGESEKDPFKQVTDYLYDFRDKKIRARFADEYFDQKLAFGYCVLLPDAEKPAAFKDGISKGQGIWTIEYTPALVGDINDLTSEEKFSEFIGRIRSYWLRHAHNKVHNGLNIEEARRLALFIRDDLRFEIPLPRYLQISEAQTVLYTKKQGETILRLIERNSSFGFIINGGPGTGKTLIARELLIKRRQLGEKVLFVCRNKSLADFLRQDIGEEDPLTLQGSEVIHTVGLYRRLYDKSGLSPALAGSSEEELAAFNCENISQFQPLPSFDYLIIDEGQDLFFKENMRTLEFFLKGGFASGQYAIFMDKDMQNTYGDFDNTFFKEFCSVHRPFIFDLTSNCRNTKGIIEMSGLYTGTPECECLKTANQKEKAYFWDSEDDLLRLIKEKTDELVSKNVPVRQITILTHPDRIPRIVSMDPRRFAAWNEASSFDFAKDRIMVLTPESFKGLENNIVIFTGTRSFDPENPQDVALWHVAFTRAKDTLFLFLPAHLKDTLSRIYLRNTRTKMLSND